MSLIVLTFTGSEQEIVSGIPKTLSIESNIPCTIYYTIDGTEPTEDSLVYVDEIQMPDLQNSVTVSAYGVDSEGNIGPTLTQIFSTDSLDLIVRRNRQEGFVLDRADQGEDYVDGFDADGQAARFIDVDIETLDVMRFDDNYLGEGTKIDVSIPDPSTTSTRKDDNFQIFSTPEIGEFFNPEAKYIMIDNRINNDLNITLRPHGSLSNIYNEAGGKRVYGSAEDACYISGGFLKRFYDKKNNIMVSYYYDNNEGKYVRNIQTTPSTISVINGSNMNRIPLVIKWINGGKQSSY